MVRNLKDSRKKVIGEVCPMAQCTGLLHIPTLTLLEQAPIVTKRMNRVIEISPKWKAVESIKWSRGGKKDIVVKLPTPEKFKDSAVGV